ncbi:hypothetical protein GT020_14560 [Glutamicibacter soli]|uniref:Alpha/beta hydrolase n=1 Tax=Glutamicibacter soli TaxID=453836 RepID=A0A6L9G813_9MICC|nr:hypothetical protein [Glutamicibacter soli]NAZ17277.1 hypothetical protein [Glutamicibacter soli]
MTRVIYIHGTGVRKETFEESFNLVRKNMERIRDYDIVPCFWGDRLGARLEAAPTRASAATPDSAPTSLLEDEKELRIRMRAMLESDPWSLIRLELATPQNIERDVRDPATLLSSIEQSMVRATTGSNKFTVELSKKNLRSLAEESLDMMLQHPLFEEYVAARYIDAGSKVATINRTFIALILSESDSRHQIPTAMTGDAMDNLESLLMNELGGEVRSIGSGMLKLSSRLLWPLVAPTVEKRRHELTQYSAPIAGDILKYFARPNEFRQLLTDTIDNSDEDTIILSHSLGGIIAFDTLCNSPRKQIKQLITVGTQIGLLYELDALPSLTREDPLPASFPEWINIYDSRDFLAYSRTSLLPGQDGDLVVDSGVPFPRSHTSYFDNPKLYNELDRVLL